VTQNNIVCELRHVFQISMGFRPRSTQMKHADLLKTPGDRLH